MTTPPPSPPSSIPKPGSRNNKVKIGRGLKNLEKSLSHFNLKDQMHSYSNHRFFTWFILIMIIIYILYSSNLLLFTNVKQDCSISTNLETTTQEEPLEMGSSNINTTKAVVERTVVKQKKAKVVEEEEEEEEEEVPLDQLSQRQDTELKHIVFGIAASSNLWDIRKEYIKVWWKPNQTRGVVWLDKAVSTGANEGLPPIRISGDTSKFKYTNTQGQRSALRISRVVTETLKLGMEDVRWFMMGDDDTVFVVDNLVRVLSKYDHTQFYYVGSSSESHVQNIHFS